MTRPWPRWAGLASLVGCSLALTAFGILSERADLFPLLRFALQRSSVQVPSTLVVDRRQVVEGLPILSIYFEPGDLEFLLANKMRHGRDFERRASVSFFDKGRLLFVGAAGARIHGGGSRVNSPRQGFRLFFRRHYGFTSLGDSVLFGPASQPLQRLVVHNDVRQERDGVLWHLVNPLGYDIARRVGCITPETLPARFIVNGEDQGLFVLTEHYDDEYFASHRPGHVVTMKTADMEALWERLNANYPLTMAKAATEVDLENVVSWFITVVFLATRDAYQGPGQFWDETDGRWFWVTWDVDLSFRTWNSESYYPLLNVPGEIPRGRRESEPRPLILGNLIAEDPSFRAYLASRVDEMLNHQLTPGFLDERRRHYEEVADRFGVTDVEYQARIRDFLSRRRAFVRDLTEQWLDTDESVRVTAGRDGGGALVVDGYEEASPYEGLYFPGREVVLRVPGGNAVRWYVDGSPAEVSTELRVRADRPLAIVATQPDAPAPASAKAEAHPRSPVAAPAHAAPKPIDWRAVPGPAPGQSYQMSATETTVAQYRAFATATGARLPRQPRWSGDDHPVVNLTWGEASAFCAWAGGRLPTEAEWEVAARAGSRAQFPWGDGWDPSLANVLDRDDPWPATAPVASFPPNALGLYDVVGNVWEWTSDAYRPDAGDPEELPPQGHFKAIRGGCWASRPGNARLFRRAGLSIAGRHNLYVGIRCAR